VAISNGCLFFLPSFREGKPLKVASTEGIFQCRPSAHPVSYVQASLRLLLTTKNKINTLPKNITEQ